METCRFMSSFSTLEANSWDRWCSTQKFQNVIHATAEREKPVPPRSKYVSGFVVVNLTEREKIEITALTCRNFVCHWLDSFYCFAFRSKPLVQLKALLLQFPLYWVTRKGVSIPLPFEWNKRPCMKLTRSAQCNAQHVLGLATTTTTCRTLCGQIRLEMLSPFP